MALTDTKIRQAKPKEKDYKLSDARGMNRQESNLIKTLTRHKPKRSEKSTKHLNMLITLKQLRESGISNKVVSGARVIAEKCYAHWRRISFRLSEPYLSAKYQP